MLDVKTLLYVYKLSEDHDRVVLLQLCVRCDVHGNLSFPFDAKNVYIVSVSDIQLADGFLYGKRKAKISNGS